MRRQTVSGRCASGIRSPTSPKLSSPTSWRQERSGKVAERDLRAVFVAAWGDRPISEITKLDVLEIINTKKRTAPQTARALLILVKRFFNWAIDQHVYGLTASPCDRLAGEDHRRAAVAQPTPHRRRAIRVLASHRADEVPGRSGLSDAAAHRAAAERSRADVVAGSSRRHRHHPGGADEGPRTARRASIWCRCRRRRRRSSRRCRAIRAGHTCSRFSAGKRPLTMTSPIKRDLDRRMLRTFKAMARRRGEDHHAVKLPRLDQPRSAPRRPLRSVAASRPAQRRGSRACAPAARHRRHL